MNTVLRLAAWLTCLSFCHAGAVERPHIVYILAGDLGWKDVGYHGGPFKTPALDALAANGARLERFYTQTYSTQTRAALMTGRYPMRYGLQTLSILPANAHGLPTEERLLPEALREAGYRTVALGTWQLGHHRKEYWPTRRGFDSFLGSWSAPADYFRKTNELGDPDWRRNEQAVKQEGHVNDLLAAEATQLIGKHDRAKPLFLYLSLSAPEFPWQAPKKFSGDCESIADADRRGYCAMVTSVDATVGAVVGALDKSGMGANTLLIFHSDNGGARPAKFPTGDADVKKAVADNGPYRDGRGSFYEGALRVVALTSWPGQIAPGIVTERIHVTDWYPTLLGIAGAKREQKKILDGIDQWESIGEGKPGRRKEILLGMEDFRGALLQDNWKLIVTSRLPVRHELYNVQDDPSEEDNRAERDATRTLEMLGRLNEYAWEMAPSLYLQDMSGPHKHEFPIYWGDNPGRP